MFIIIVIIIIINHIGLGHRDMDIPHVFFFTLVQWASLKLSYVDFPRATQQDEGGVILAKFPTLEGQDPNVE